MYSRGYIRSLKGSRVTGSRELRARRRLGRSNPNRLSQEIPSRVSIDEAEAMLNEIAESMPKILFKDLNGGVMLLPDYKPVPNSRRSVIMGEYCTDIMGRYIKIYYGSIAAVYGRLPAESFKNKLFEVLRHELTHHVETLAGDRSLVDKDEREKHRYI